jgi:hypothetical protein
MSRRRLRMTCESALRVAEWRLAQQQRRTLAVRLESKGGQPVAAPRPSFAQLSLLWIVVGALVLGAIALSSRWAIDKRVEVDVGLWIVVLVALGAAAVIVTVVLALTSWRWKTRRGGR